MVCREFLDEFSWDHDWVVQTAGSVDFGMTMIRKGPMTDDYDLLTSLGWRTEATRGLPVSPKRRLPCSWPQPPAGAWSASGTSPGRASRLWRTGCTCRQCCSTGSGSGEARTPSRPEKGTIIRWSWPYCYSNTGGAKHGNIAFSRLMRVSRFRWFGLWRKSKQSGDHCPAILFPAQSEISKFPAFCLPPFPGWALNAALLVTGHFCETEDLDTALSGGALLHLHLCYCRHARRKET